MRRKWKRALSLLCTLAMIAGMLPVSSLAAAGQAQTVDGGINGYAATMQADEVTNQQTVWQNAFYLNGERSADLNGKIWTDKSVSIGDNNDFDVTFSALGQTFASQEASQSQIAFDVVFVVDVSNSMGYTIEQGGDDAGYPNDADDSRMAATVTALNSAADQLLENNSYNRIAVVPFSGTVSNNNIIPLANYSKAGDRDFFSHRVVSDYYWERSNGFTFTASNYNKCFAVR